MNTVSGYNYTARMIFCQLVVDMSLLFVYTPPMSDHTSTQLGTPLMEVLEEAAKRKGLNKQELAKALGVTYGYLVQLKNAIRDTRNISDAFADACASFLGAPRIQILFLAGRMRLADFCAVGSEEELFRLSVWKALEFIKGDAKWGCYFPYGLLEANADPAVQQFVVLLYESATGKVLLDRHSTQELTGVELPEEGFPPLSPKRKGSKVDARKTSRKA